MKLGMNSGEKTDVDRPIFVAHSRGTMDAVADNLGIVSDEWAGKAAAALVNDDGLDLVDRRGAARRYLEVSNLVPLKGVLLPCRQQPRICSERGIKHGFSDGKRCSKGGFLMTSAQPGWRRS